MSSCQQSEEEQQHTFTIVPTRVINERTYECDLLVPNELPTDETNMQQTCVSYVCNNNTVANNNTNYTSVSSYASNASANQSEKTLFSVEPHLLLFPPPHHGRCIQNVLMLHNSSAKEMCVYKFKCEKPHAFVAKHNVGLMYPNSSLELRVTLRAVDKESDYRDKQDKDKEERNNNDNDEDDKEGANSNSISYKEINENTVVHFRLEIKFFKKLPERFAKHLHFRKEHFDNDESRDSDEEEKENEEENDIENNNILNERVNAREVWNYFALFDEHSNNQHHHRHFNEHYHEDEEEEQEEGKQSRHRSSGITQCEVIDLKALFDGFTKRPETSTIIELPADYPNGLHSYTRRHRGHSTSEKHNNETDNKTSDANENNKTEKESSEQKSNINKDNNENKNTTDNKVDDDKDNNKNITNDDVNKSIKTNNSNNNIIDHNDADAPPSMLSASPTKRSKLEDANTKEQKQKVEQNASTAPPSITTNPVNANINNNAQNNTNNNHANIDDNISFDSKAMPRNFEEVNGKASTIKTEAAASAPSPPTSAQTNKPDNMEAATESLFELYPNDDKPTNRAEPTDAFNDTTDALTSDKRANEHEQALPNEQQKHISFANYSNTLLQAPLSIDNLAASIRASTMYNKSVVLTNKLRPYANMLLICIGFICVLALLLPPPQEKQQPAK